MLNYVASHGVMYSAFNGKISVCKHKHAFIGVKECPFWESKHSFFLNPRYKNTENPRSVFRSEDSLCAKRLSIAMREGGVNM